jgi:hypothetical protein
MPLLSSTHCLHAAFSNLLKNQIPSRILQRNHGSLVTLAGVDEILCETDKPGSGGAEQLIAHSYSFDEYQHPCCI